MRDLRIRNRRLFGSRWKVGVLDRGRRTVGNGGRRRDLLTGLSNHVLSLLGVIACICLYGIGCALGVVSSELFDLCSLLRDHVAGIGELLVNDLLVLDVDEGSKVEGNGGDQGKAPEWDPLDQEVGDEGRDESQKSGPEVLGEEDSLKLDNKEV